MKQSIVKNYLKNIKLFNNLEGINYYLFMLKNNSVSLKYPKELRDFHKGVIIGLSNKIKLEDNKKKEIIKILANN